MLRLLGRKLLLLILLLPLLNFIGFAYATLAPTLFADSMPFLVPQTTNSLDDLNTTSNYLTYFSGVLDGDWGRIGANTVWDAVWPAVQNSFVLLLTAVSVILLFGPLLGFLSISRRTQRLSPFGLLISTIGLSLPRFFLGGAIIAAMIYGVLLVSDSGPRLPISGYGLDEHLILPVVVLATGPTFRIAGIVASLLEQELQKDYIRFAQSRGFSQTAVYLRHALPNIAPAIVTTIGNMLRLLIGGLIVVETLFLWPGIGQLFMFVMGLRLNIRNPLPYFLHPETLALIAMWFGLWLLLTDLITTLTARWLDPRTS
ncbi:MAG: ABC transporter permease [Chloroflexota bacterium]